MDERIHFYFDQRLNEAEIALSAIEHFQISLTLEREATTLSPYTSRD